MTSETETTLDRDNKTKPQPSLIVPAKRTKITHSLLSLSPFSNANAKGTVTFSIFTLTLEEGKAEALGGAVGDEKRWAGKLIAEMGRKEKCLDVIYFVIELDKREISED